MEMLIDSLLEARGFPHPGLLLETKHGPDQQGEMDLTITEFHMDL